MSFLSLSLLVYHTKTIQESRSSPEEVHSNRMSQPLSMQQQQQAILLHLSYEENETGVWLDDTRVVRFGTTLSLEQLGRLLFKIQELTQTRGNKVLFAPYIGCVLMSSDEDAVALSRFIAAQRWKRNPYATSADITLLMQHFRPASVHSGVRIARFSPRGTSPDCDVVLPEELLVHDAYGFVSREATKMAVARFVAQACGVCHNGWLNANTTIVFLREQPVRITMDSPESAARLREMLAKEQRRG